MKKNDIFTVDITDMTNTGAGVARIDGMVVFVNGGCDRDRAEIKIIKLASGYAVARVEKIIEPSPYRRESDCAVSKRCGGCVYRCITYAHELELKRDYVAAAFKKQGLSVNVADTLTDGLENGWRSKIAVPISEKGVFGYYADHTHEIIPCTGCGSHMPIFNDILSFTQTCLGGNPHSMRHMAMRAGESGVTAAIIAAKNEPEWKRLAEALREKFNCINGVLLNINAADTNVIYGDKFTVLSGDDYIEDRLCGLRFRVSMPSFYQVNHGAAELAYKKLLEYADIQDGDRLLDLYCGTGTIGLFMKASSRAASLTGVEIVAEAVENAKINAALNGIEANFICRDAGELDIAEFSPDVLIVDPPRKGLSAETVKNIISASPKKIAYMSCDPDTLARDCALLSAVGYGMGEVTPINMFPRAGHIETVCLLSKLHAEHHIEVNLNLDETDLTASESKATYDELKAYVLEQTGLKVSSLNISQVKRKNGIIERENYNKPKSEDATQPQCPPEKETAIVESLKHFGMIKI